MGHHTYVRMIPIATLQQLSTQVFTQGLAGPFRTGKKDLVGKVDRLVSNLKDLVGSLILL